MNTRGWLACAVCVIAAGRAVAQEPAAPAPRPPSVELVTKETRPSGVARLHMEAAALRQLAKTEPAWRFLAAAGDMPRIEPRELFRDPKTRKYYSEASAAKLPAEERESLTPVTLDEQFYYTTKYGSPMAFVRPMELLGQRGLGDIAGKRLLDFGYGSIGNLRLLAAAGVDAVGVDVDPLLRELYNRAGDQGAVKGSRGIEGRITLVDGRWPAEEAARHAVGGGYDVIVSKNTLKNGYIHPERPVDKRMLVDLGVDDAEFVKALFGALKPGGWVLIYNLCPAPAPADKPYIPWADGRCPFPREMWEAAGFIVKAFDVKDDEAARAMGKELGWEVDDMDLENDLFAWYTLVQRPAAQDSR